MLDTLKPTLEITVIIPGIILAYFPVRTCLRTSLYKLLGWILPLFICLSLAGGALCRHFCISTAPVMTVLILTAYIIYAGSLRMSLWKSGSVALSICAVLACVNSLSRAINAIITADSTGNKETILWFSIGAGIVYNLICWIFTILAYYPASHAARHMIDDENFAQTWYVFWILPLIFIVLNIFMVPQYRSTLYTGRILKGYIIISLTLLALLVLFYAMFLMLANNLNKNAKLLQENHFLSMQRERYDSLKSSIEEARQARHDMRHYFNQIAALAETGDMDGIKSYLSRAVSRIPNLDKSFCENRAADSVLGYYYAIAEQYNIPFLAAIDLPEQISVDEIDMCLVLSNLLENAIEASLRVTEQDRHIKVETHVHADHLVLIHIENAYNGKIWEKNGVFQSAKRKGNGVGIQSIRHISDKTGGASSFTYKDGIFTAKVMIRG